MTLNTEVGYSRHHPARKIFLSFEIWQPQNPQLSMENTVNYSPPLEDFMFYCLKGELFMCLVQQATTAHVGEKLCKPFRGSRGSCVQSDKSENC